MVSWGDDSRAFISEFSLTEILGIMEPCDGIPTLLSPWIENSGKN
jgi:hypothetical protein